jgi:hypothetical protein
MELAQRKLLLEIQGLLRKGNTRTVRRDLSDKLRIAGDNAFELLHQALSIELGKETKPNPEPPKKQAMECKICKKHLPNGINSWVGAKRNCKKPCTKNDLVPCQ